MKPSSSECIGFIANEIQKGDGHLALIPLSYQRASALVVFKPRRHSHQQGFLNLLGSTDNHDGGAVAVHESLDSSLHILNAYGIKSLEIVCIRIDTAALESLQH